MGKTVFVTGAGGYIGRHAVHALCEAGAQVLVPSYHAEKLDARAERLTVDIFSGNADIFRACGAPDVCLHLAWRDGFRHNADTHLLELPKHYVFLRDMLHGGLEQLAVMGTMHEVGPFDGEIGADTPCRPDTRYGIAKDALRRLTGLMCREQGAQLQWLRGYYITGDDRHNHSVFSHLLAAAERGEESFPFTLGRRGFDFIDVEELAAQIAAAVLQKEVCGVIECCSGHPESLGGRAERFIREQHLHIRLDYGAYPEPQQADGAVWGSRKKINAILGAKEAEKHGEAESAGAVGAVSE